MATIPKIIAAGQLGNSSEAIEETQYKVWIINRGAHAYTDAARYGKLVSVTHGRVNVFAVDNLVKLIKDTFDKESCGEDYLLLSGYSMINAIAVHYFLAKYKRVKILMWHATERRYIMLSLDDFVPTTLTLN